ncbi:GTP 3',8-cyclase MoaA [Solemya velesiana gill symbiont]|uniref:GTP 3',8-cyclase n=1 Tax=Solemya velesiana gill symbiont TaxID=1918948 RepID=A0A1T2KUE9_9GAMM|nr:GTP 3',8-cyclase MoaA [Solemya velesiana gill symbiont]OOZ36493.1 cyclic pyranopterin phosphate synthase MoaA [Solemya velesiana gill symbiont]
MSELIDRFGRKIEYLRLSVTDRCDFRCFYCIPKGFNDFTDWDDQLTLDEYVRLIRIFSELGVSKVRFTGGEPLVRRDIVEMVQQIGALAGIEDLSMSTNASQLAKHAKAIREAGVSRLNVSLDTLKPDVFKQITQGDLNKVIEGLMAAKAEGFHPIKINMVVMRDLNFDEVGDMVNFCLENRFTLRFIETMPVGAAGQNAKDRYVSLAEVREMLEQRFELEPAKMKGAGPAKYLKVVGGRLKIGFINPMSQHFCEDCNRVRLSSEGTLYLCLGQQDKLEFRPLLRQGLSDEQLKDAIREAINRKPEKHEFNDKPDQVVRVMSMTGG